MTPADQATAAAFRQQIQWCAAAPFTADVIAAVLRDFEAGGDWRRLLGGWPGPIRTAVGSIGWPRIDRARIGPGPDVIR